MTTRSQKRAERLRERADIGVLLQDYGYGIHPDMSREQQYSCDLHGPDNKPSARYYPRTNSVYCFACGKARDPIGLVMDKEGVSFREACDYLEGKFGLPPLPWDAEAEEPESALTEIDALLSAGTTYEQECSQVRNFLDLLIQERDMKMQTLLAFVEAFDRIEFGVRKAQMDEDTGKLAMQKLHAKIMASLGVK